MGTIAEPSLGSALTSQTTQNKSCLHASCRDGVLGEFISYYHVFMFLMSNRHRCDARWDDLDTKDTTGRRAHRHTEAVFEALGTKEMWDDNGIINDIMVSGNHITIVALPLLIPTIFVSHSLMDFRGRIFMSSFPLTFSIK